MNTIQLPGWLRKELEPEEPPDAERWAVAFYPPAPWLRQASKTPGFRAGRPFLWRPTDQTLPIPDNPNLWVVDDPVIVAGWPGVDASEYHRLTIALKKAFHTLAEMLASAVGRATKAGQSPLADPECRALMSAMSVLHRAIAAERC